MRSLATLPAVALFWGGLVFGAPAARAQDLPPPSTYAQPPPGWVPSYYYPPPPPPPPPAQLGHRWGVGLRLTSQQVAPESAPDEAIQLGGGGLHVRWRFARGFSIELELEGVESDPEATYRRSHGMTTVALAWHLTPGGVWDWFVLAGIGGGQAEVSYQGADGHTMRYRYDQTHARLAVGLERRWHRLGIGAEVGAVGMAKNGAEEAPRDDRMQLSGGQLNLSATYYF